jgi:hypothetical protein
MKKSTSRTLRRIFFPGELPDEETTRTWTDAEEHDAKIKHLKDVAEANDSFEFIQPSSIGSALKLSVTWVVAIRDQGLKARLCARDFARTKRMDLFAPGSTQLTSRVIDLKAVRRGLCGYTVDVTAAYNTLDEPENVVVTPPVEWLQLRAAEGKSTNVLWKMEKVVARQKHSSKDLG